ncbi:cobyric acid synthase [Proteiniclasticum sp.]|uniref:cobyric acid synthase n=1 Tax=Proteiniclasticum sp. TaxID=2053595 RepID=UPI00289CCF1D|nr:cobyric acid synthase [Proteiniclasticum sp.]
MNRNIMIQGTSSSVGKSILTAALCRIFTEDGFRVTPFKSQNMSLNSHVTMDGYEMGRAQVLQAEACKIAPRVEMNPILLKPSTDQMSQVIVMGRVYESMNAKDYFLHKSELKKVIMDAYDRLMESSDIIVIEGAGSPAEINLKEDDIVNMGLAEMVDAPVILVADIDRGGVFASIYGTVMLLTEKERKRIKGIIINKFRGDITLLQPGIEQIEKLVGIRVLGTVPYFSHDLDDEDSVVDWSKFSRGSGSRLDVVIIKLPYLSNLTDFQPLSLFRDVNLRFADLGDELGTPDLLILPGTKSTVEAMKSIKASGMEDKILACHEAGTVVMGICGGYQMLGRKIIDRHGVESDEEETEGMNLIDMVTTFREVKKTSLVSGNSYLTDAKIRGYEIHMGESEHGVEYVPLNRLTERNNAQIIETSEGVLDKENGVLGTYLHGIFDNAGFTKALLSYICLRKGFIPHEENIPDFWVHRENELERLAETVRKNIDMEALYAVLHN